jgi:hypothetical protein
VAEGVSDADVQYRPLFNDDTAAIGTHYYYLVVARNSSGASAPSNVVGPVTASHRQLVDECSDLKRIANSNGAVTVTSENARRTQEDVARLALAPGAEIVYHTPGPIRGWHVYTFSPADDAKLAFAASADGNEFTPLDANRKSFASGRGEYGYFAPLLFEGGPTDDVKSWLKISMPAGGNKSATAAPNAGGKNTPGIEISRVEIDFQPVE